MKPAVDSFQRWLFTILLYASSVSGILGDIAGMANRTTIYALYDGLIIFLAVLSISYVPKGFGIIITIVLAGIIFNFSYSPVSLYISVNGIRDVLMFIALPIFYYRVFADGNEEEQIKYMNIFRRFCWFFLLLQTPAAFWQYLQYGPSDYVGGTYGNWNSGSLSLIIICMVFYLNQFEMAQWKKIALYLMMAPLVLNETKISFILIPMMMVFIYFEPKIKNMLFAAIGGVLFFVLFSQFYSNTADWGTSSIFSADFLQDYLLSDYEDHADVPRFTKIILAYNILAQETNTLLFGMEFGMFRGTSTGDLSPFTQNWQWLLQGTRPYLFFIMMQGGLVLTSGFLLIILKINNFFKRASKQMVFYLIIFLVVLVYQDMYRFHNFSIVYFFFLFFVNSELFKSKAYLEPQNI